MKRTLLGGLGAAVFCLMLSTAGLFAIADQYEQEVEIVGTVVAVAWDDDGNAIEIEVDSDQDVYPIEPEGEGAELLDYVGDVVNIQGVIYFDEDDELMFLRVDSFYVIEEEEE